MIENGVQAGIILLGVSFFASTLGGMLGMASGIFIVPILSEFCGIDLHTAIAASLVSVIACSCGGAAQFLRSHLTNIRLAVVLEVATTLGALTGVFMIGLVSKTVLYFLFALILGLSAKQMLTRRKEVAAVVSYDEQSLEHRLGINPATDRSSGLPEYQVQQLPIGMGLMYGAGLISALLGIGSGVLKIPAMDTALRLPIKVSSATSNFMIGVTAAASACAYFARGDIQMSVAAPVVIGSVVGAPLGAHILMKISGDRLRLLFSFVLVALAIQMVFSGFGIHALKAGE